MKNILFKIIDVVCFIGGSLLFVSTLFNYLPTGAIGRYVYFAGGERTYKAEGIAYSTEQAYLLALGIGLIVLGFLIRNWSKEKDSRNT